METSVGKALHVTEEGIGMAYTTLTDPEQHKKIKETASQIFTNASSWFSSTASWGLSAIGVADATIASGSNAAPESEILFDEESADK